MSLLREYRIRELYLKRIEESFSKERILNFREALHDCEDKLAARYSRISKPGAGVWRERILYTYIYSLFDLHSKGHRGVSPRRELERFQHFFAFNPDADYSQSQIAFHEALKHCRLSELLNAEDLRRLVLSMSLFQAFLSTRVGESLLDFSRELREFMIRTSSSILDDESYEQRVRLYGQLLQISPRDEASSTEALRLSLQCMPSGEQRSANLFLYIMVKIYRLWPEIPRRLLQVPADADLMRVVTRVGLTSKRLSNLDYGTVPYTAIQAIAKRLSPEDPSAIYGLKYVAKVWCKSRSPNCFECAMSSVCDYAENALV